MNTTCRTDPTNRSTLLLVWEKLYLPPHIRDAWQPLIDSARTAA